jgi:heme A synthase
VVEVHKYIGLFVVAVFTVGWVWGLGAWILKRGPGDGFWIWVTVAQIVAGAQALIGVLVYLLGYRAPTLLHYAYGIFPIVALVAAHSYARRPDFQERPWVPFAWVAFICFGLTLRAVMTGLGTA